MADRLDRLTVQCYEERFQRMQAQEAHQRELILDAQNRIQELETELVDLRQRVVFMAATEASLRTEVEDATRRVNQATIDTWEEARAFIMNCLNQHWRSQSSTPTQPLDDA